MPIQLIKVQQSTIVALKPKNRFDATAGPQCCEGMFSCTALQDVASCNMLPPEECSMCSRSHLIADLLAGSRTTPPKLLRSKRHLHLKHTSRDSIPYRTRRTVLHKVVAPSHWRAASSRILAIGKHHARARACPLGKKQ